MSTYSNLSIELIGTGEQDGTWGATTNVNLGTSLEESIVGTTTIAVTAGDTPVALNTSSNATQPVRNLRLNLTGSGGSTGTLTLPTTAAGGVNTFVKNYIINNASNTAITARAGASDAGVLIPAGNTTFVYTDGTNLTYAIDYHTGVIDGATIGATTPSTGAFTTLSASSTVSGAGVTARFATPGPIGNTAPSTGAFTTFAASGAVSGAGVTARFATPGPIGSSSASTGAFTTLSATSTVSGAGFNNFALLNDYSTFVNSTELITISATNATGTINYDTGTQSVVYYTAAATGDWTVNFRHSSGATLNSKMATGEAITLVHLVTLTGSEYRNSAVQVDGSAKTPEWQGGAAPTEGNINSIDSYTYTIIKTGDAAFTVLAALVQFA
jgi:hypothetical protein